MVDEDTESFLENYPIVYVAFWLVEPTSDVVFCNRYNGRVSNQNNLLIWNRFRLWVLCQHVHLVIPVCALYTLSIQQIPICTLKGHGFGRISTVLGLVRVS